MVGQQDSLPTSLNSKAPYQFEKGVMSITSSARLLQSKPAVVLGQEDTVGAGVRPKATVNNNSSLGETALLMQFESPFKSGNTVVVLTAASGEMLMHRANALVTPEFWTNMKGDVISWQETDKSIFTDTVGATYHKGSIGVVSRFDYYFSHYPWLWVTVVLLVLLGLVLVSRKLIAGYRKKHYGDASLK